MKRHRSEPPSAGTPADDQAEDAAMPNLARGVRELIDGASTGLLVPGTEEDKWAKEVMEANRKAEEADPEFKRRRQKGEADLQAWYDRHLGVSLGVAQNQEELILDLRRYAASYLLEAHSPVAQLRVTRLALEYYGITPKSKQFPLSFERTHAAIWTEGDPSLEELANKAGEDESADTQTRPVLSGTEGGDTDPERPGDTLPVAADEAAPKPAATVATAGKNATAWTDVKMQPGGDSRPTLPLDTQAVIERTKQGIIDARKILCPHLFQPLLVMDIGPPMEPPPVRKTANVKIELETYSSVMFDADAEHYGILAATEAELRGWLEVLASSLQSEVMADTERCSPRIHLHCSASERLDSINHALGKRIEHWCNCFQTKTEGVSFTRMIPGFHGSRRHGAAAVKPLDEASEIDHIQTPAPNADRAVPAPPTTGEISGNGAGAVGAGAVSDAPATISNLEAHRPKRGPRTDYETAARVAEIVTREAPDGKWRPNLDDILMALDDAGIPTPKTWGPKQGYRNWYAVATDTAARGRHMAIEAIKHHLKRAKEKPAETIP